MTMTCECVESPIEEIYRIRKEISAQYDHDPYKLYCAVLEDQRERARQGQVFWGYNAVGELVPLSVSTDRQVHSWSK